MATFVPNPLFNPDFQSTITPRTKLGVGTSMSKFLSGNDRQQSVNHLSKIEMRRLAKQYSMHAKLMAFIQNSEKFKRVRLVVAEGYYRPLSGENLDIDSLNYYLEKGQAVIYEVIDMYGKIDHKTTFDVAETLINNIEFERLVLSYDTYNPDNSLTSQICVVMPRIVDPWTVNYKNEYETRFNNFVQATNELIECGSFDTEEDVVF